jgi:putative ABC transport system permease protein
MRAALAIFGLFLIACPREMREEYGAAMREDFVTSTRSRGVLAALHAYADVLAGGLAERFATLGRDLGFALRGMRRAPLFALVVIVTTAVAIGANGAVYGLVANILLRPLPVASPSTLAAIWEVDNLHGNTTVGFSFEDFDALRHANRTLGVVSALSPVSGTIVGNGAQPQILRGASVSGEFFGTYAARPQAGRLLDARDERDGSHAIVLSDELWRTRFKADPAIVGKTVQIADVTRTVVGIAPPRFFFVDLWRGQVDHADYFVGLRASAYRGGGHSLVVVARPSADLRAVDADLARTFAELAAVHPVTDAHLSARSLWVTDAILGPMRPSLIAVALAVLAVLAVACANVANLFLSRSSGRGAEIATRFALGASRRRLIAQLMTETSLYVAIGGVLGLALSAVIVHWISSTIDAGSPVVHLQHLDVDWKTFAATGISIVIAAVLAGTAPALALSRPDIVSAMKSGDRSSAGGGRALRAVLVTLEVALAIAVVATAAIASRSYYELAKKPLGFETRDVSVVFMGGASSHKYATAARVDGLLRAIRERVNATPGVQAAGWAVTAPFLGQSESSFQVEGAHYATGSAPEADVDVISTGYFGALRIPVLAGRDVATSDGPHAAQVVVVSRSFAERYLGGVEAAIGKRITMGWSALDVPSAPRTVVGVVGDIRPHVIQAPSPTMYAPLAQLPTIGWLKLAVRSRLSTEQVAAAARSAIASVDATIPPATATSLEHERYYDALDRQMTDIMLAALAAVALALATGGIYAVVSYGVARRTREIGVRVAFGATPRSVIAMVLRDALRLAAVGIALGLAFAAAAAWALKAFLDVDAPVDGITALTVLAIVAAAIGFASYLPARRAARVEPVVALRYE